MLMLIVLGRYAELSRALFGEDTADERAEERRVRYHVYLLASSSTPSRPASA